MVKAKVLKALHLRHAVSALQLRFKGDIQRRNGLHHGDEAGRKRIRPFGGAFAD